MYNIKIDYMRNHFNFLTGGKILTKIKKKKKKLQTLQNCEISKNYLRPLWYGSQRVNFEIILILLHLSIVLFLLRLEQQNLK